MMRLPGCGRLTIAQVVTFRLWVRVLVAEGYAKMQMQKASKTKKTKNPTTPKTTTTGKTTEGRKSKGGNE